MGLSVKETDALIEACTQAGVVFRPRQGQLRPLLTRGRPPDELLARVKSAREAIVRRLADLMDFDDIDGDLELPEQTDRRETSETDEWRRRHAADSKR